MSKKLVETLEKNIQYLWVIVVYVLTGAKRSLATTTSQTVANDFAKCFFFKVTKAIKIRAPQRVVVSSNTAPGSFQH